MVEVHLVTARDALPCKGPFKAAAGGRRDPRLAQALGAEKPAPWRRACAVRLAQHTDFLVDVAGVRLLPLPADKGGPCDGICGGDGFGEFGAGHQALSLGAQAVEGQGLGAAAFLVAVEMGPQGAPPGVRPKLDVRSQGAVVFQA